MLRLRKLAVLTSAVMILSAFVPTAYAETGYNTIAVSGDETAVTEEIFATTLNAPNTKIAGDWIYSVNTSGTTCTVLEYIGDNTDVIIPDTLGNYDVTSLDFYLFKANTLTSVTIPASVSYIQCDLFLNYITLSEKEYNTGTNWANPYDISHKLKSINVAEGSKYFTSVDGVLYNYDMTELVVYPRAKNTTVFTIPDGVKTIENYSFSGAVNLTKVNFPDSMKIVYHDAFDGCSSLATVNFNEGLEYIYSDAFYGCAKLSSITLPESLTDIYGGAFRRCTQLTSVRIPANIEEIGYGAFAECTKLKYITVDTDNQYYCAVNNILYDKNMTELIAYPAGKAGIVYTIADGITSIGDSAFAGAINLSNVTIPSSVIIINDGAFMNCSNLTHVNMNVGLKVIGDRAFSACNQLTNVYIPEGVVRIGTYAFNHTINSYDDPERVFYVPSSATQIAEWAFGHYYPKIMLKLYKGSHAETYAKKYNIPYEYIDASKPRISAAIAYNSKVALNWTAVDGAEKYAIYTYLNGKYTCIGGRAASVTGMYVTGLTNGTKYGFLVRAYVNNKWSSFTSSDIVYATPVGASKPKITKAIAGNGKVALNWTAADGATKYVIYTYLNGKYTCIGTRAANVTGMYVTGLTNGTKYGFLVRAYINGAWTSFTAADIVYATPSASAAASNISLDETYYVAPVIL